jgi:hypothetical protein
LENRRLLYQVDNFKKIKKIKTSGLGNTLKTWGAGLENLKAEPM